MTAWKDVERAEPEFAQRVRGLFDGHRHKTIATLRADGSPRISGIEVAFEDGELAFGSMPNAPRARIWAEIRGSHCTAPRSTRSRARKRSGRVRRRSLGGRSMPGHSPRDPTATASTPTSPRSCARTSMRRPRCSSLSGGPPRTGCAGSSASDLRPGQSAAGFARRRICSSAAMRYMGAGHRFSADGSGRNEYPLQPLAGLRLIHRRLAGGRGRRRLQSVIDELLAAARSPAQLHA